MTNSTRLASRHSPKGKLRLVVEYGKLTYVSVRDERDVTYTSAAADDFDNRAFLEALVESYNELLERAAGK